MSGGISGGMTRVQADVLLLVVAVIWGLAFVTQSWGMEHLEPFAFTGFRFALGALVVAPLAWREWQAEAARPQRRATPAGRWPVLITLGLLIFAGASLQQIGMVTATVTNAGFLTALYVPLVPLLGWLIFRHRPHWVIWPAAAGCVAGTWLLAGAHSVEMVVGDAWIIASSLPWALHVVLVGWAMDRLGTPYLAAFVQFAVTALLGLIVTALFEHTMLDGLRAGTGALAYAGLVSVGIGYTAQVVAQRHAGPADAALILSSETVFAAVFGALLTGDRLHATGYLGCALILACILASQLVPMVRR